jgi:diadenosine tetraphosphate (Ap4A) HIT family hydrolase
MSVCPEERCPFCDVARDRIVESDSCALAIADAFPVSAGHTLILPRRHVVDFFELTMREIRSVYQLLRVMRCRLDCAMTPAGYNIGVNIAPTAGQTVMHAHVHLIPRYPGDVRDPAGGVRNVIPHKARYQ